MRIHVRISHIKGKGNLLTYQAIRGESEYIMKTFYSNYAHAMVAKKYGTIHDTLKSANAEKRELNKNNIGVPHITARFVAPNVYGEDTFYGYYVCPECDEHLITNK